MPADRAQSNAWMQRASSGDAAAFGLLASAMQEELYRFGLAHGLSAADAAEATQESLLRAYRARRRWQAGGDAAAWLYGIAMNVVREFRRKRRPTVEGLDLAILEAVSVQSGPAPVEQEAELRRLAVAVAELPPRQREAVTCRYLMEMSVRDTAAVMGCAEGTVKAAVAAALEKLRKAMTGEH